MTPQFQRAIVELFMIPSAMPRSVPLASLKGLSSSKLPVCVLLVIISATAIFPGATGFRADAALHQRQEHKRDYKREIEAVEEQWRKAQLSDDVATMDKLMAEDYFGISFSGQLNDKMQQLERLRSGTLVFSRLDVSDTKIKLVGRVAIVTSLAEVEGKNGTEPIYGRFRYTRVYKRYPEGTWRITNFETTRVPTGN